MSSNASSPASLSSLFRTRVQALPVPTNIQTQVVKNHNNCTIRLHVSLAVVVIENVIENCHHALIVLKKHNLTVDNNQIIDQVVKSTSSSNEVSNESTNEEQSVNFQIVDMYFDIVSLGCPIIQRATMLDIIAKNPQNEQVPENVALLYAIQANCFQNLGKKQDGRNAFLTARKYLSQVFDLLDNFSIAGAFLYMGLFCLSEGELAQCRYYLGSVQFFIDRNKDRLADNLQFIYLCRSLLYTKLQLDEAESLEVLNRDLDFTKSSHLDVVVSSEKFTQQVFHMKKMMDFFLYISQHMKDGDCGLSGLKIPQPQFSSSAEEQAIMAHAQMILKPQAQFNRVRQEKSLVSAALTKLMYLLMVEGVRLGILSKTASEAENAIIETANRISELTTVSYFPYLPAHVHSTVMNAARVHLTLVQQIVKGLRPNETEISLAKYYDYLRSDLKALTQMAQRFSIVEKRQQHQQTYNQQHQQPQDTFQQILTQFTEATTSHNNTVSHGNNASNMSPSLMSAFGAATSYYHTEGNTKQQLAQQSSHTSTDHQQLAFTEFNREEFTIPEDQNAVHQISEIMGFTETVTPATSSSNMDDVSTFFYDVLTSPLNIHLLPSTITEEDSQQPIVSVFSSNSTVEQTLSTALSQENYYTDPYQSDLLLE
ncbi:hypothetical protein C9374_000003 [Naegleria lovaniensis]|uniref:Uncharacterized protein n=1 Tax=Naegleria lovaniensis TaxID=51637 RepID=A0AA88GZL2_NAELO|nr:uncharacterized protein C9374_000003 [Naegleria lovaniensis]KAG2388564.1 hypothetical protein C9374_000003 [Naegleria lovaniensis]